MNFQIGFLIILGVFNPVSVQSLNFTSSLQTRNMRYTCSGDVATFLCSGVGSELIFYAPPFVNISSPIRYLRGENLGEGDFRDPLASNLISTTAPEMVGELTIRADTLVQELTVRCIVRSPLEEGEALYRREGTLRDVSSPNVTQIFDDKPNDFTTGLIRVSWTGISGNFDISHYTVEFFVNGSKNSSINVSPDVFSTFFSAPVDTFVYAIITVNSACGRSTAGVTTNNELVIRSQSIMTAIAFFAILAILVGVLVITVVVLCVLLYYCKK